MTNDERLPESGFKQVLVLRHDLKMRKGKIAAQAAHASMGVFTRGPGAHIRASGAQAELVVPLDDDAVAWLEGRFRKICVYVTSEADLLALHAQAQDRGLRSCLIQDSGFTEFGGVPTYTALAIGPHRNDKLDPLTGQLPLY